MSNLSNVDMSWHDFVVRFFQRIGARSEPWAPDKDVAGLRVELTQEQLRSVEGRPAPFFGWNWGGPGPEELTTWYLTLEDVRSVDDGQGGSGDSDAAARGQLCIPGSFRGRQLIDAALRLWPLGRMFLQSPSFQAMAAEGRKMAPAGWRPHIVFHFLLTYMAKCAYRRSETVAVDLVTGDVVDIRHLGDVEVTKDRAAVQKHPSQTARLSVGDAHDAAMARIRLILADEGDDWAAEQSAWVAAESEMLETFVRRAELEEGSEAFLQLRSARFAELDRLRPRVRVEIRAATIAYVLSPVSGAQEDVVPVNG